MRTRRSRGSTATAGSFWRPRAIEHSESTASVYGCPVASVYALRYPPDFALSLESRVSAAAAYAMSVETRIVRTMLSPLFGCSRAGTQHPSPRGCQGVRVCAPSVRRRNHRVPRGARADRREEQRTKRRTVGLLRYAPVMKNEPRYVIIASNEPKPMGETLLDYARPLIQQLPHDHTLEELKAVVIFAAVLWNVQVVEDISGVVRYLSTKMPPRLRVRPAKGLVLI